MDDGRPLNADSSSDWEFSLPNWYNRLVARSLIKAALGAVGLG